MKEHSLEAGGRRWYGTDFVELQKEPLDAATGIVADAAPCILSGAVMSVDPGDIASVAAGFAAMKDGAGNVRIVRVPASVPQHVDFHPRWLTLAETPTARLYDDNLSKEASREYVAQWVATQQTADDLYYRPADQYAPRFFDRMGQIAASGAELHFSGSHPTGSSYMDVYVRINRPARLAHLRGALTVSNAQSIGTVYNCAFGILLPTEAQPVGDVYFPILRRPHSVSPEHGLELSLPITGAYRAGIGLCAHPTKPADATITNYTGYFNVSWPMP